MDCEQTIKNLELENERLQEELSKCEKEKRDLAILHTLLAEKLNEEKDKSGKARKEVVNAQVLADLASQQRDEMKSQKKRFNTTIERFKIHIR